MAWFLERGNRCVSEVISVNAGCFLINLYSCAGLLGVAFSLSQCCSDQVQCHQGLYSSMIGIVIGNDSKELW